MEPAEVAGAAPSVTAGSQRAGTDGPGYQPGMGPGQARAVIKGKLTLRAVPKGV